MADVADKPTEEVAKNEKEDVSTKAVAGDGAVAGEVEKPEMEVDENAKEAREEKDDKEEKEASDEKKAEVDKKASDENEAADDREIGDENGDGDLSKLERSIIRQVEYYFGDANLNRDKFLLEQISKDEEGWVPISVMIKFKRLNSLSSEPEVIVDALMKSDEGLVEVSDDKQKLRRHPERPIPEHNEERRKEIMSRTAYAKGFPLDTDMSALIEFFGLYEKVVNISMRKYLDKPTKKYKFKGSVFVTFEKKEQTQEFIEKDKVVFQERELIRKWQDKYLEDKKEEMKAKSKKSKAKTVEEETTIDLPKGTVLFFEGVTDATISREILREALEKIECDWEIAYIDFSKGDNDGHIRFHEADAAAKYLSKLADKKLKLKDIELTLRTLSTEEEAAYLQKAVEQMKQRRNQLKHKGHGHAHHGHGNRKRRGNDNRRDEKKQKTNGD